jgi:hypothetical protein
MTDSRWWIFILILIVTAAVVLCIFNAITYNKIANEKMTLGDVTPEGARALMAINIIFLIFLFPLWIWYIYKLVVNDPEKRKVMLSSYKDYAYDKYSKGKNYVASKYDSMRTAATPSKWNTRASPRVTRPVEVEMQSF